MVPVLVGVAGGSGSGKTTIVKHLVSSLGADRVLVLGLDNYYHDLSHLDKSSRDKTNFDHPNAIDWSLLRDHLTQLGAGESVIRPTYSFTTHSRTDPVRIDPHPVIVLDGILSLYHQDVRDLMDLKVFVDTDKDLRFIRRLQRDVAERGRTNESVIAQYLDTVRPMHAEHVAPQRDLSDLVVPWDQRNPTAIKSLVFCVQGFLKSH